VKFGEGFFHFVLSLLPPAFQWFLNLIGIQCDRDLSLEDLDIAWKSGCIRSFTAGLLLNWIYFMVYDDFDKSIEILTGIDEKLSESFLNQVTFGYVYFLESMMDEAQEWFEKAAKSADKFPLMKYGTGYFIGDIHWLRCEWGQTKERVLDYINNTTMLHMRCYGYFKLGFSDWMLGERGDNVITYFKSSKEFAKEHFDHDTFALYMIEKYENLNKFTKFDEIKIPLENLILAKDYDQASEYLAKLKEYIEEDDFEGENGKHVVIWESYFRALVLSGKGQYDEAITVFTDEVLPTESKIKKVKLMYYIIPYSLVELGEIHMKQDKKNEALSYFNKAKGHSDYLFYKYIYHRITRPLEAHKRNK